MKYFKLLTSTVLTMFIATTIIWFSLFAIVFSALSAPITAWWKRIRNAKKVSITSNTKPTAENDNTPYKVIEAKYEIISK